nr:protein TIC 56, chloroplastic [Ipomoea batatas]
MPNKYIPKDLRIQLAKIIPGLRPWEVLSVEQAMDQLTFGRDWYREPLGSYTTGPPYIYDWNRDVWALMGHYNDFWQKMRSILMRGIPGFGAVLDIIAVYNDARLKRRMKIKEAKKDAELEIKYLGHRRGEK